MKLAYAALLWLNRTMEGGRCEDSMDADDGYEQRQRVNLKESTSAISHGVFRSNIHRKGQPLAAGLSSSSQGGIHTLMFVSEVKLDLSSIAIVADACVLPLTHSIMPLIATGLRKIACCKL